MTASHPFEQAKWIWPADAPHMHNTYAQYRRDFDLAVVPKKAPFHITADQSYKLYVNGRYVGRGPARGYQVSWPYDSYDIAEHLSAGRNWISVVHYNGGISTFGYNFQWRAGMLCAGRWKGFKLVSDANWLSRVSPAVRPDTQRVSVQLNLQEHIDARLDDGSWITSARPPKWKTNKTTELIFGVMPWHSVEARSIPNLSDTLLPYRRTCTTAAGPCAEGYRDLTNAAAPLRDEWSAAAWSQAPDGRVKGDAFALTIPPVGKDRFTAISIDLGILSVGSLIFEAGGAAGGEILDLYFGEVLLEDGSPLVATSMAARVVLRKGRTKCELFQLMGHRYLTVILRDGEKPVRLKLSLRESIYPMDVKGRFAGDDPVLNDIHGICERTQRICMLDSYVDTPWREQAQWWGDARVQAANTFFLSGDARLLARGVRSIVGQDVPNGLTYGHAPTNSHACILPDFTITWVMSIWDHYWQTGSTELFQQQWPRIERVLGYFRGEGLGKNGLLRYDRRYWLFLDWSTLPKIETPTLLNLWYVIMLDSLATLCRVAGDKTEAARLADEADAFRKRIERKLWDAGAALMSDGLDEKARMAASHSIHAQTASIMAGIRTDRLDAMIERRLLPYLRGEQTDEPIPSSFWVHYVYELMAAQGYGREVVEHIRRNYAPMVPYGGTWEIFKWSPGRGSVSHAWSAHPIKHLANTLGGINQAAAAWTMIRFAPVLDAPTVGRCEVTVPTPQGPIRSRWRRTGDNKVMVALNLPRGVRAECRLPGEKPQTLTGSTSWTLRL